MEDYVLEMEEDEVEMQDIIAERNLELLISNERGCGHQETVDSAKDVRDVSVVMMLSDPAVLDCSICFESLTIPMFQVYMFVNVFNLFIYLFNYHVNPENG